MRRFTAWLSRPRVLAINLSVCAVLALALLLTSCVSGIGRGGPVCKFGEPANEALDAVHAAEARGEISPEGSGADWWDSLLRIAGQVAVAVTGLGAAAGGVTALAKRQVNKYDAKPFTAEDVASIEAAKAAPKA